jgi:UrcA family protein
MILVAVALAIGAAAQAAEPTDVIVKGSRIVSEEVGRNSSGIPIRDVSLTYTVKFEDVDVRTPAGRSAAEQRITSAARDACRELNRLYPVGKPTEFECVKIATKEALARLP